jgi:hypothetical protein
MNAPASVPTAVPIPPEKDTPPIIEDVRASSSKPWPASGKPAFTRDMYKTPAIPTNAPLIR